MPAPSRILIIEEIVFDTWVQGRVVLIGDAAHWENARGWVRTGGERGIRPPSRYALWRDFIVSATPSSP
jgi:hypothetical protein